MIRRNLDTCCLCYLFEDCPRCTLPSNWRQVTVSRRNRFATKLTMSAFVPHLGSLFAQSPQAINSATSSFRSGVTSFVTPIRRKAKLRFNMTLASSQENMLGPPAQGLERLICAAGCFWGLELAFQRVPGVISTRVGYTQGKTKNPSYRAVCFGITGHTEALAVDYDPKQTSYAKLLDLFWKRLGNSALTLNRAGNDVGTQYRSGVYYLNDEQKNLAQQSAKKVSEDLGQQVITEIKAGVDVPFYLAEEDHQKYLEKGGQCAAKGDTTPIRCYG